MVASKFGCLGNFRLAICSSLFLVWGTFAFDLFPAMAEPRIPPPDQETSTELSDAERDPDYNGQDFTRPQRSVETRLEYRTSSGTSSRIDRETLLLRATWKAELEAGWKLGLLAQVPFVDKTTKSFDPPSSTNDTGISDSTIQGALSHAIDQRWAFGLGARLVAPAAQDALGTGKWQIMPGFAVRYAFLEMPDTYFVPVIRYAMSFAGDPTRRNIREPQIAPTLNIGLPDRWFVTFYPSNDIRINFGDPISGQTGRLFLPLDVAVGRKITDSLFMSLEVSVPIVKEYPVYNFKTELKIALQF